MAQTLRFSVITPCLNMSAYLEETILSVLNNLSQGDQFIVIDGGSTDGSVALIRKYESRLTGWVSERDRGHADALAKGFAKATGDILCWINAGDLLLPGALDAARQVFDDSGADMIFGDDLYVDEEGRVIFFSRGYVKDLKSAMLYGGWTPLQDACFWTRALYQHVGGINPLLKQAVDYDLFLRMAMRGTTRYVPLTFSVFRRHGGQKSIAAAEAYRKERVEVRRRELAHTSMSASVKSFRLLWHGLAIRWRVHVMQRRWRCPDLVGRPVHELSCRQYWPPANAV
jgi:glycosyltransferase involved in cell wall biosynthesis